MGAHVLFLDDQFYLNFPFDNYVMQFRPNANISDQTSTNLFAASKHPLNILEAGVNSLFLRVIR